MRSRIGARLLAIAILTIGLAGAARYRGDASQAPDLPENFHRVSAEIFRSGQPESDEFRGLIDKNGLRSVLNLRQNHDDLDEAKGLPLKLYRIPMRAGEIRHAQIVEAMTILRDCPKPVLVHCWHGSDRTGCIVAAYRMLFEGWPKERAIREFKDPRYGHHEDIYPNIERYLRALDIGKLKAEVR